MTAQTETVSAREELIPPYSDTSPPPHLKPVPIISRPTVEEIVSLPQSLPKSKHVIKFDAPANLHSPTLRRKYSWHKPEHDTVQQSSSGGDSIPVVPCPALPRSAPPLINNSESNPVTCVKSSSLVRPVFIELCSGCARLSFFCRAAGCHSVPIDHTRNTHKNLMPTIILDLSIQAQSQIVVDLLRSGNVALLHAGVPCGTCSRAREIPLRNGRPGPPPLRSQQ